jgi:hypothetical protein
MKKISALLTLGLLFNTENHSLNAHDFTYQNLQVDFDDDDDFSIDTDLNNISLANTEHLTRSKPITRAGSAEFIYNFFGLIADNPTAQNAILNLPIYQQTSPIRNRPILEYPFTLPYAFDMRDENDISVMLFLNPWSHKNFTKDSTTLDSYFLLGNPARANELQFIDNITGEDTAAKISKSLVLFDPATAQENRIGGVIEAHVVHNRVTLNMQLPVLYTERNLYLTPSQKAAISLSSLGGMLATDGVDEDDFIYNNIVMDQFGLGDLKFKAMYTMHATEIFDLDLGGFVILPTATALKQGIIGTWFDQNNDRAYFDLTSVNPLDITTQNQKDFINFFLAAVDKLSSNILNCPLGNNGHVVIAPSINFDWNFAHRWKFSNDFSVQIPLPANEQRFYQKTQSEDQFLASYNAAYDAGAENPDVFAAFVNGQLQDLFFPYVFSTMVYPGTVFNSTNQIAYQFDICDLFFGSNFWYQSAESLEPFNNAQNNQNFTYDDATAAAASAAQEKLFMKLNYNCETTNYFWSLSFYGDITIWNSGIGKDFTLGLGFDCKF